MRLPEPWGKETEKKATELLWECEKLAGRKDVGWFIVYLRYEGSSMWPWACAPDGRINDLRKLAGLI